VRRLLLILGSVLIVTALLAPAAMVWSALFTTSGLQFLVRHIPQKLGPVRLVITGVSGTIADGLEVERLQLDHDLVHLDLQGISGRLALAPLLLQTIRVTHGHIDSVQIQVKRRTHPSTPGPPSFLPRWLIVSAESAELPKVVLSVYNGFHLEADRLHAAAVIRHDHIRFFQAEGLLQGARVSAIGQLRAADPLAMEVQAHIDWQPAGQPAWTVDGSADGDLDALNIVAHTLTPFRADINGQMLDLTRRWHWAADADVQSFELRTWGINSSMLGTLTGHLAGTGDAESFSAHGPVESAGLHAGIFNADFIGSYANHVLTAKRMELRHVASGARAGAAGTITIVDHGPRLELSGDWDNFRWPLAGRDGAAVRSASGAFTIAGLLPYRVHAAGRATAGMFSDVPVDVHGELGRDSFGIDAAELDLLAGHASVTGRVSWSPQNTWTLAGHATGIDPRTLRPDLPGSISFTFNASGRGFDARSEASATFAGLSGRLRGVAASGAGTITRAGHAWGFDRVRLALGATSLALDGHIDARMDLRFGVSATDLNVLTPEARGELKASGTISGASDDPVVVLNAHGGDFQYQGVKLEAFDADISFNPGAPQLESKVDARLRHLTFHDRTIESITLSLTGLPSAYDVRLAATAPGLSGSAQARGSYAHGVFSGELRALNVTGSQQLHLSLDSPVDLTISAARVQVEWLCLLGEPASVCADGDWTPTAWSSTVMTNELPLNALTAGMTPAVTYLGTLSALLHLSDNDGAPVQGTLRGQLANAEIAHRLASRKEEHTRIGSGTVNATATPALISAQLSVGDSTAGTIRGAVQLQRTTARWQDMPLSGELHAHTNELGLLTLYAPDIDRASGALDADVQLAGTAGSPTFAGLIKVTNGEIDVYQVNLALRQTTLAARLSDSGVDFSGDAHAGAGQVSASGHLEWRNLLPYGKFHLQGANLRVASVPEAQIDASPDLDFAVDGRRIEVTGKVVVPYAKIHPRDITNAVRTSSDEIIVGSTAEDPAEHFEVVSTITLVLGDKVNLDAMGLQARLTGSVTVRNGYDAITRGTGELSVAEGKYTAYARILDIQRGRLLFSGGPIDDPGVDVIAQKQFPDITAGVKVRGTLTQPRISFFSDPPLPQSQVASLILGGGSLQSAQNPNNAAIGQGAALLAAQLGPHVGVPDVSLETDPIANETSLVLGRYLSPRLYVSYGVSLTEQLNTFKMRYTLGDHWTIRTELGQARGADLVYSIIK
jgi:translocation and assembly module TamB